MRDWSELNTVEHGIASENELGSKYVTFRLAGEDYGLPVEAVIEVIRIVAMAEAPESPDQVAGLINIRGDIVPVVDMRRRLNLEPLGYDLTTPILITGASGMRAGLIVDYVSEVVTLPPETIETVKDPFLKSKCVSGVAKAGDGLIFLLDLRGIFTGSESAAVEEFVRAESVNELVKT